MGKTLDELKAKKQAQHPGVEKKTIDWGLDTLVEYLMENGDEILKGALAILPPEDHAEVIEIVKRLKKENLQ